MKIGNPKVIIANTLMALLLMSLVTVIGSSNPAAAATSENDDEVSTSSDGLSAASGSNRFVVWVDETAGNRDIFFKRSTDNGATWKAMVNLSSNPGSSSGSKIAVSGSNVYVVWVQFSADDEDTSIFFRKSTDNGATWGSKIKVYPSMGATSAGVHLAASGSNVYIVVDDGGRNDIVFIRSTDNGATWQPSVNLSDNGSSASPQMVASGSNVYVAWVHSSDIFARRSTDNGETWKPEENLSDNAADSFNPHLAASGSNVYVLWSDFTLPNTEVLIRRSTDNGATWKSSVNLSNNPGGSRNSQIVVSGSKVYVVWAQFSSNGECQPADIFFRGSTNSGATWGSKIKISSSGTNTGSQCTGSLPQVAASGSNVYITWDDTGSGSADVFLRRSTNSGATWKSIVNMSNNAGNSITPQITVSGLNAYVVWSDNTPGNLDILLKRSTDGGATWKAVKNLSNNAGASLLPRIGV